MIASYVDQHEPQIAASVAKAMVAKGFSLTALNRSKRRFAVFDEVITRHKDIPELQIAVLLAGAMIVNGLNLIMLNRSEKRLQFRRRHHPI